MGLIQPLKYRKLNRLTGLWEWVYPVAEEYVKKDQLKNLNVKTPKKKRK